MEMILSFIIGRIYINENLGIHMNGYNHYSPGR